GGVGVQNDFFDLKTYTDAVPPNGSGCKVQADVVIALGSPGGGYEQLRNDMGQGALVVNMETHGNRYLAAHEQVLCSGGGVFCNSTNTPDAIQNPGRPFYLMIWGCHTNQFPDFGLIGRNFLTGPVDSLDALGEMFLFIPGRGSIASLGSTSLEF